MIKHIKINKMIMTIPPNISTSSTEIFSSKLNNSVIKRKPSKGNKGIKLKIIINSLYLIKNEQFLFVKINLQKKIINKLVVMPT